MTESPYGQHGARLHPERPLRRLELRDTPEDLLDALRFTSQEDRGRLLDPALWRSLETIIHNQRVLFDMLERLLGRTSTIVTDLSAIANAVSAEQDAEQSAITLLKQLADEVRANAGDPAAVQALADQITTNATALSQAVTANTPAASSPTPVTNPTASTGATDSGGTPAASGSVDLSGTGDNSGTAPAPVDTSAGTPTAPASEPAAASTTADVSTSSVGQTATGPDSSLSLYQHVGSGPVDFTEWPLADVQDASGNPLYYYAGDTPGGAPTGASADWQVYTGPTQGQVDTSSASVPHTPIDTTNTGS